MDPHVERMARVLEQAQRETGGEIYHTVTHDERGTPVEVCPALRTTVGGRNINILLFDVPGSFDHFSIILDARLDFVLTLREEARWDFVLKRLQWVEDHIVGEKTFDRKYLIGGRPREKVIDFLKSPIVRELVTDLSPFLHLGCEPEFVRATFALRPDIEYEPGDLRRRVKSLHRLAEEAEKLCPAPDESVPSQEAPSTVDPEATA